MAVVRIPINPLQKGRVGAYSMYVRKGEQVVRQRKNASNYGEEASRSLSQQQRRVLWSNLVNFYKANKAWMPKSFENIQTNQTVYNRFMQLNIDQFGVAFTKSQAQQGWCVVDAFKVADGSLYPIKFTQTAGEDHTIRLTGFGSITASSTVGAFSQAIINENQGFQDGDNIAIILFEQLYDAGMYPIVVPHFMEITLDVGSTQVLSTMTLFSPNVSYFQDGKWILVEGGTNDIPYYGWVGIHTRKDNGLKVSTQSILIENTELIDRFSTEAQVTAAIESYGLSVDVPLAPSFKKAVISQVTLNGSPISPFEGRTLEVTGAQTLVISGPDVSSESVKLWHEGTLYTPLVEEENSVTYILGDNGSNRVELNGRFAFGVTVSGIQVPAVLPLHMNMSQRAGTSTSSQAVNLLVVDGVNCVNYPYKATVDLPYFGLRLGDASKPFTDAEGLEGVNCTLSEPGSSETWVYVAALPTDATKPAYITYEGFIVAVFNY